VSRGNVDGPLNPTSSDTSALWVFAQTHVDPDAMFLSPFSAWIVVDFLVLVREIF